MTARPAARRVVIVGYGMAGARLASELLARQPDLALTAIGAEPTPAYNRILLSNVVAGTAPEASTLLPRPRGKHFRLDVGVTVECVDRDRRTVSTSDGVEHGYDALALATGSAAIVPPIPGLDKPLVFRTLADCHRIAGAAAGARTALVLGGGLLGLEAARGLARRGIAVTVVHAVGHLMERQLDPAAAAVLTRTLAELGVRVRLNATALAALPGGRGLRLADGTDLAADLTVIACGVRPETTLATRAGLAVLRGILVDERLRTSDPDIYAIGDCAEVSVPGAGGALSGLVAPAWQQATVVADLLTGVDPAARYRPVPPVTRLKANGVDLAAMGDSAAVPGDEDIVFVDPRRGRYAKLVVQNDRLVGAIMIGDQPAAGTVIQHFDRQSPLPPDPRPLLLGRALASPGPSADSPALMPDSALVCRCNGVTKGAIVKAWLGGERDLATATRAGTGCGGCGAVVDGIAAWLSNVETPVGAPAREAVR